MSKCGACGKFLPATGNMKCSSCKNTYHKHCMDKSSPLSTKSMCSLCFDLSSNHKNPEEKNEATNISSPVPQLSEACINKFIIEMQSFQNCISDLKSELTEFREEIKDMRNDMNEIYSEFLACKDDVSKLSERTTEIEKRLCLLENTENHRTIGNLQETIQQLQYNYNENEQQYLRSDVEIVGVPETKDEDLGNILKEVTTKLKLPFIDADFIDIFRVGPTPVARNIGQSEVVAGQATSDIRDAAPRPIVMRCARREDRDRLVAAARARPLSAGDVGLPNSSTRIYFNERLTKYNKKLLYKTMQEKKKLNWKYVWTKEGRILVRREEGERAYRIRREEDLGDINYNK